MSQPQFSDSSITPQAKSEQVITVQHLVKKYGEFVAVNDISFSIREKEIFGAIIINALLKVT